MITLLDIIDTAVKIGLGAGISGYATYVLTKRQFSQELIKSDIQERRALLKEIAIKLETVDTQMNTALSLYHKSTQDTEGVTINDATQALLTASNDASQARALSNILGLKDLTRHIGIIYDLIYAYYSELNLEEEINKTNLDIVAANFNKSKSKTYPLISKAYDSYNA